MNLDYWNLNLAGASLSSNEELLFTFTDIDWLGHSCSEFMRLFKLAVNRVGEARVNLKH